MTLSYAFENTRPQPKALVRTLQVWLISNLGGTAFLSLNLDIDSSSDLAVPLIIGLMAAMFSLAYVPLAVPFFTLSYKPSTTWRRQIVAIIGIVLVFAAANCLLLRLLPIGPLSGLLPLSLPYLGAAVVAVAWLYQPRNAPQSAMLKRKAPATPGARLLSVWWHCPGRPYMVHGRS